MNKIRKGDNVKVMRGRDAGLTGEVLKIVRDPKTKKPVKIVVKDVNVAKIHRKPNPLLGIAGEIVEVEKPIAYSNVMLLDGDKPTRVKVESDKRVSVKTGKEIK